MVQGHTLPPPAAYADWGSAIITRLADRVGDRKNLLPDRFLELHPSPVLLHAEEGTEDGGGFVTAALQPVVHAGRPKVPIDPSLIVLDVCKRQGGPFLERVGVGRTRVADVRLPYGDVSKYHAFFERDETGRWFVTDAGSRNGTLIDGVRIEPKEPCLLREGAVVSFSVRACSFHTAQAFYDLLGQMAFGA